MRLSHPSIRPTGRADRLPIRRRSNPRAGGRDDRRRTVCRGHRRVPPHRDWRAARSPLRHGCLLRLRGDGGRPHRPARLHDQGGRRHGRDRRGNPAARPARRRTRGRAGGGPGLRRAGGRRRTGRLVGGDCGGRGRRGCRRAGRAQRHRRAIRQAAGRQPRRCRAGCAVPPGGRASRAGAGGGRSDRDRGNRLGRLRGRRDRRSGGRTCGDVPAAPPGAGDRCARAACAAARLDPARRHDHRRGADAGASAARVPGRARADRRQRSAQSAACL